MHAKHTNQHSVFLLPSTRIPPCTITKSALKLLTFFFAFLKPLRSHAHDQDLGFFPMLVRQKRFCLSEGRGTKCFQSCPFGHPMKSFWFILLMMSVLKLIVHIYFWFASAHVTALCVMGDRKYYRRFLPIFPGSPTKPKAFPSSCNPKSSCVSFMALLILAPFSFVIRPRTSLG